jgi:hypothetical protein
VGLLDEPAFTAALQPCACGATRHEIRSVIDQWQPVMLAESAGAGRWVHDGEKFVDGTYRISCTACGKVGFENADCPRCHAPGALARVLGAPSRLEVPRDCPQCGENQLVVIAMVPSTTVHTGGRVVPKPLAELGDDGFHVVRVECDDCGVIAEAAGCPCCGAPGPLRERP